MANTRLRGPLLIGGPIVAVGTSLFPQGRAGTGINAAGTVIGKSGSIIAISGISSNATIRAGTSVIAVSGVSTAGTIRAGSGFGFMAGNYKKMAMGTYYGVGGATAPIIATGLSTISWVELNIRKDGYSTATTGMAYARPCKAAGTPGSFYPILFKTGTIAGGGPVINTVAGTFCWAAYGT